MSCTHLALSLQAIKKFKSNFHTHSGFLVRSRVYVAYRLGDGWHPSGNALQTNDCQPYSPITGANRTFGMVRKRKIKNIRLHSEGNVILRNGLIGVIVANLVLYFALKDICLLPFYVFAAACIVLYGIAVNFFRCPLRQFPGDVEGIVVAAADGKVVVIEEVEENEYFHDRRLMISIFMSITNVHANWFPVEGVVKKVVHHNGNFHKAWLPKASIENERSTVVIETPEGHEVLVRQVAGAVARRIVTYAVENEECCIDEHMGFIKFGSRVDVYLPLGSEALVKMGQATVGNQTVVAKLPAING